MILVVGGFASGKREYVRGLGFADGDFSCSPDAACPVLVDAQELVRASGSDPAAVAERIAASKQVAICVEVGSGIVPLDPEERAWRDRAGELARELARRASAVVRVVCGIPAAIKGELPAGTRGSVQVVIMRHGATKSNAEHRYAGRMDVPLSERGEEQARAAGVCPGVERVFVSPLVRARRTAEICFPNAGQVVVSGLQEMNFGDFEGRTPQEMEDDAAYRAWVDGGCVDRCPNGERRSELEARVSAALERIVRDALLRGDRRVVVVGHGGTVMAAMGGYSSEQRDYFGWQVGNCQGFSVSASIVDGQLRFDDLSKFEDLGFLNDPAGAPMGPDCNVGALPERPSTGVDGRSGSAPTEVKDVASAAQVREGSSFFQNRACEYFPCHEGVPESEFNCLFCYCPLYALGPDCGGNCSYTERGRKNCAACALPHRGTDGVKMVAARYEELARLAQR